ncbi:MAG: DUF3299 domain-containing protein [Planctomycetota bacterium]
MTTTTSTSRHRGQRGFTQPLAVVVGLMICVALGYAIMRGFSYQQQPVLPLEIRAGAPLDAPLVDPNGKPQHRTQGSFDTRLQRPDTPAEMVEFEAVTQDEVTEKGYMALSFSKLSNYRYVYPDPDEPPPEETQIPDSVEKLDGKKVAIRGFMLGVKGGEDGRVTEFLLMRDQSYCCFGIFPQMNEWIHVTMDEGMSAPNIFDLPATIYGTLSVGEEYDDGVLMSIYRVKYDKLVEPKGY